GVHHEVLQLAVGELLVRPHTQSLGHRVLDVDAVLADLAEDLLDALLDGLRLGLAAPEDQLPDAILVNDAHTPADLRSTHNLSTLLISIEDAKRVGCIPVVEALGDVGSNRVHTVFVLAPAPVVSEDVVEHHVRHGVSSPLGDLSTSMVPAPGPTASGAVLCSDRGRARVLVSGEETQPRPLRRPGLRRFQGGLDGLGTHVKGGAISTPL